MKSVEPINPYPLMKCGHVANSVFNGKPACAICALIHPGATVVEDQPPDLAGRTARCLSCGTEKPSSFSLPFFEIAHGPKTWSDEDREAVNHAYDVLTSYRRAHRKDSRLPEIKAGDERLRLEYVRLRRLADSRKDITKDCDHFYCGCRGWE